MRRFGLLALLLLACSTATLQPASSSSSGEPEADAEVAADGAVGLDGALPDGGPPITPPSTGVRVVVEPTDNAAALLAAVRGAKTSVHVIMYLFTNDTFLNALVAQKNAGREVKVILNQNYPFPSDSNDAAYNQLKSAGVDVVWAPPGFTYSHSKGVLIDGKEAWIMTMNLTRTSPLDNREYLVVDSQPSDVAEAEAVFSADFGGQAFSLANRLVVSPLNARARLLALVRGARTTIDISAQALSDTELVTALIDQQKAGVTVRAVVEGASATQPSMSAALGRLKRGNVVVKSMNGLDAHAKAVVVDGVTAYVGSINFTKTSMDENRELGVIFSEPASVGTVKSTIASDFAGGTLL